MQTFPIYLYWTESTQLKENFSVNKISLAL